VSGPNKGTRNRTSLVVAASVSTRLDSTRLDLSHLDSSRLVSFSFSFSCSRLCPSSSSSSSSLGVEHTPPSNSPRTLYVLTTPNPRRHPLPSALHARRPGRHKPGRAPSGGACRGNMRTGGCTDTGAAPPPPLCMRQGGKQTGGHAQTQRQYPSCLFTRKGNGRACKRGHAGHAHSACPLSIDLDKKSP